MILLVSGAVSHELNVLERMATGLASINVAVPALFGAGAQELEPDVTLPLLLDRVSAVPSRES